MTELLPLDVLFTYILTGLTNIYIKYSNVSGLFRRLYLSGSSLSTIGISKT